MAQPSGQDPATPETAPPAQTEAAAPAAAPVQGGSGPWANDLAQAFPDESVRASVDEFLRGTVQPHVTKLEQSVNEDAERLYSELTEHPGDTYMAITSELWGDDVAEAVRTALLTQLEDGEPTTETPPAATTETETPPATQLPEGLSADDLKEIVQAHKDTQISTAYATELARTKAAIDGQEGKSPIEDNLFHPFVAAAGGDFALAYQGYDEWYKTQQAHFSGTTETEAEAGNTPPPVIGSTTAGSTAPPTQTKHPDLDSALDEFFAEQRASAAPVVGST